MKQRFLNVDDIPEVELFPGFHARMIHSETMSVIRFRIEEGRQLQEHSHPHEQITNVLSGKLEMTVGGETHMLGPGNAVVIPSNTLHSGFAHTECIVLDVFQPVREDYLKRMS